MNARYVLTGLVPKSTNPDAEKYLVLAIDLFASAMTKAKKL